MEKFKLLINFLWKRFIFDEKRLIFLFFLSIALQILFHIFAGIIPYFYKIIIDSLVYKEFNKLKYGAIIYLFLQISTLILLLFQRITRYILSLKVLRKILIEMYKKYHTASYGEIIKRPAGGEMQKFIDDSFNVSPLISQSFSDLAGYISFFLVVIFIMFKLSIWLLLFSILLLGIYFIGYKIYSSRMNEVANLKQKTFSIYTKELEEGLNLTYDIRVHGILDRAIKRLTSSLDEFFKKYFDFLALNLKYQGILTNGILAVSKIGVICIGIIFIMKNILTVGDLVAFVSYTGYLYEFLSFLVTFNITVEPAFVSLNRLKETLELEEVYIIRPHSVELPISQNYPYAVEIKNLNFGYNNTNLLFRDFNLKIKNRSITGIYGKSGCGKTTLLNLFLKLYKVNKGEIFVFGKDINDYSLYEIHKIFTVVEQEPKFFSDTVWENFRIFLGDNKEKEIKEIASMLGMGGLIENLTSREVGAKLSDLSGGERKRLGILRSLLVPNPIILMDEPTSFLDKESARIIFENLVKNFKNKTIIIFSHDPFVKQFCEDVIELESLKEK